MKEPVCSFWIHTNHVSDSLLSLVPYWMHHMSMKLFEVFRYRRRLRCCRQINRCLNKILSTVSSSRRTDCYFGRNTKSEDSAHRGISCKSARSETWRPTRQGCKHHSSSIMVCNMIDTKPLGLVLIVVTHMALNGKLSFFLLFWHLRFVWVFICQLQHSSGCFSISSLFCLILHWLFYQCKLFHCWQYLSFPFLMNELSFLNRSSPQLPFFSSVSVFLFLRWCGSAWLLMSVLFYDFLKWELI